MGDACISVSGKFNFTKIISDISFSKMKVEYYSIKFKLFE